MERTKDGLIFDDCADYIDYAHSQLGIDRQEAYRQWRRAWWEFYHKRSWRYRRKGVKGKRRHYTDASTATEEIAT